MENLTNQQVLKLIEDSSSKLYHIIQSNDLDQETIFQLSDNDVLVMLNHNFKLKAQFNILKNKIKEASPSSSSLLSPLLSENEIQTFINEDLNINAISFDLMQSNGDSQVPDIHFHNTMAKKWPTNFLFPKHMVSYSLSQFLPELDKDTKDFSFLSGLIKILYDLIIELDILYPTPTQYDIAARSILIAYPHLDAIPDILKIIKGKLQCKFREKRRKLDPSTLSPAVQKKRLLHTPKTPRSKKKNSENNDSDEQGVSKSNNASHQ